MGLLDHIRLSRPTSPPLALTPQYYLPAHAFSPRDVVWTVYVDRKKQQMTLDDWLRYVRSRMSSCGRYAVLTIAQPTDPTDAYISALFSTYIGSSPHYMFRAFSVGCGKRLVCPYCAKRFFVRVYNELVDFARAFVSPYSAIDFPNYYILYIDLTSPPSYHVYSGLKARRVLKQFIRDYDRLIKLRLTTVLKVAKQLLYSPIHLACLSHRQRQRQVDYLKIFIDYCSKLLREHGSDLRLRDVFDRVYRFTEPIGDLFWKTGKFHPHHNLVVFSPVPVPVVLLSVLWKKVCGAEVVWVQVAKRLSSISIYLTKYLTKNLPKKDANPRLVDELLIATYNVRLFSRSLGIRPVPALTPPFVKYVPVAFVHLSKPLHECESGVIGEVLSVRLGEDDPSVLPSPDVVYPYVLFLRYGSSWVWLLFNWDTREPVFFSYDHPTGWAWAGAVHCWSSGIPPPEEEPLDVSLTDDLDF